jgi:hypothetical protein
METCIAILGFSSSSRVRMGVCVHEQVCFLGPELGPLAGLLVGPQMGSWLLEEAHVSSSRTRHTDRCTDVISAHLECGRGKPSETQVVMLGPHMQLQQSAKG